MHLLYLLLATVKAVKQINQRRSLGCTCVLYMSTGSTPRLMRRTLGGKKNVNTILSLNHNLHSCTQLHNLNSVLSTFLPALVLGPPRKIYSHSGIFHSFFLSVLKFSITFSRLANCTSQLPPSKNFAARTAVGQSTSRMSRRVLSMCPLKRILPRRGCRKAF